MAYEIKFNGKSLNADRSASLKAFDKSQVSVLRVVTNEILHSLEHGDTRGLHAVMVHVANRTSVFTTIRQIVSAATDGTLKVSETEKGVEVKCTKNTTMNVAVMGKIVEARDTNTVGIFNTTFLKSIGIGETPAAKAFDEAALIKAIDSLVKKATDANMDNEHVLALITTKLTPVKVVDVPAFDGLKVANS